MKKNYVLRKDLYKVIENWALNGLDHFKISDLNRNIDIELKDIKEQINNLISIGIVKPKYLSKLDNKVYNSYDEIPKSIVFNSGKNRVTTKGYAVTPDVQQQYHFDDKYVNYLKDLN